MASSFARNVIVLGLLSAVGPFAIDMYLPALPAIAADLHATTSATQMTLIAFCVSFGLCRIVDGPLSDVLRPQASTVRRVDAFHCWGDRLKYNLVKSYVETTQLGYVPTDDALETIVNWLAPFHEYQDFRYANLQGVTTMPGAAETFAVFKNTHADINPIARATDRIFE